MRIVEKSPSHVESTFRAEADIDERHVGMQVGRASDCVRTRRGDADDPHADPGKLILISAHAQDDLAELIEASPAIGFLVKPALSAVAIESLLRRPCS